MTSKIFILPAICVLVAAIIGCASTREQPKDAQQAKAAELSESGLQNLRQQSQQIVDAMVKGDFARGADLTYPKLVELMGGRAQYIAIVQRAMKELQTDQTRLESFTVGEPRDVNQIDKEYYAIIPTTMKIKVPEGTLVGEAYMIGISADAGAHWTFVDSGGRTINKEMLKTLLPKAADKLRLPEVKQPTLYRQ